jgi:hypothetical protein
LFEVVDTHFTENSPKKHMCSAEFLHYDVIFFWLGRQLTVELTYARKLLSYPHWPARQGSSKHVSERGAVLHEIRRAKTRFLSALFKKSTIESQESTLLRV